MNILFLDLETTGLDPKTSAILEIGAALYLEYDHNFPISTFNRKVKYMQLPEIQLGALGVNGVQLANMGTNVTNDAQTYPNPLLDFVDWLVELKSKHKDFVVCGHNVTFDINFLEYK